MSSYTFRRKDLLVELILVLSFSSCRSSPLADGAKAPAGSGRVEQREQYSRHLDKIKDFIKEKKWCEADTEVGRALDLFPRDPILIQYQAHIKMEKAAALKLQQITEGLLDGDCLQVTRLGREIGPKSGYSRQAGEMIERCREKEKADLLSAGKRLLEENKFAEAAARFLKASSSAGDEADLLFREAQMRLSGEQNRSTISAPCTLHGRVLSNYLVGNLKETSAAAAGDAEKAQMLRQLESLLEKAEKPGEGSQAFSAIGYLEQALEMDGILCGGEGAVADDIYLNSVFFSKRQRHAAFT